MTFLFSRANVIHVVGQDARNDLLEVFPVLGRRRDRVVVIRNGIDVRHFEENGYGGHLLSEQGVLKEAKRVFTIAFLGRFMPEKGFPVLIGAVEILKNSVAGEKAFRVVAFGWNAYIREYQKMIREKSLQEYFEFAEFQPDIRPVLSHADLLVIPSLREAFPITAMEGLVMGTPIVASNCVGLREALEDTPATLVPPGDSKALAHAIAERIRAPRREEARIHIPVAKERFDARLSAKKLDDLLSRLGGRG